MCALEEDPISRQPATSVVYQNNTVEHVDKRDYGCRIRINIIQIYIYIYRRVFFTVVITYGIFLSLNKLLVCEKYQYTYTYRLCGLCMNVFNSSARSMKTPIFFKYFFKSNYELYRTHNVEKYYL